MTIENPSFVVRSGGRVLLSATARPKNSNAPEGLRFWWMLAFAEDRQGGYRTSAATWACRERYYAPRATVVGTIDDADGNIVPATWEVLESLLPVNDEWLKWANRPGKGK